MTDGTVVFASGRPDALAYPGGDTVQMRETRRALEAEGWSIRTLEDGQQLKAVDDPDLLHAFNLPYSRRMLKLVRDARNRDIPVAISTVFWDFSHSLILRALSLRLNLDPGYHLKPVVPMIYPLFHRVRSVRRSDSAFSLERARLAQIVDAADVLLPNSRAELAELCEWIGRDVDALTLKTTVVPYAADTSTFSVDPEAAAAAEAEYGINDFVIEVGKLSPNKNQLALIDAMAEIEQPLVIVGHGESQYADKVKARADGEEVIYIEQVPHEELFRLYNAASVHALPSFRDSPGLVSLEAGACGCELVVSEREYCPVDEYFGDIGHQCDPYSVRSIRGAIRRALEGDRNDAFFRRRIDEEFSWDRAAEATAEAYAAIL